MFLSRLSLKNPVMITMLTLALIIFGYASIKTLGVDLIPSMDIPVITITTVYPGADAQTIEQDIVKELEDSIGTLNDIKHINSTALDNVGLIIVQFEDNVDGAIATQNVRDKVAAVEASLPDDAESPIIEQFDVNADSIMSLVLKAPAGTALSDVTELAKVRIKEKIQSIQGVGNIEIYGGREKEIRVLLDPMKISQVGISAFDVINLMKSKSIEIPAGTIKLLGGTEEVTVRSIGEAKNIVEMNQIPLIQFGANTLRVKDLARIENGMEEEESASMMNVTPAVALRIKKQGNANLVLMADEIKTEVEHIKAKLPEGYDIEIVGDQAPFVNAAVSSSISDIFLGAILAMLIIFAFLMNKRAALIVAVSLPTSIIGTFLFVKVMGFTLNIMTTMALSISVGILTDDAIVVIEAIFRHLKKGKNKIRAAIDATNEVGLAVVSAELSLISVFGTTAMMSGLTGAIFKEFGLTVVAAVIISMIVSFTVSPLLATTILKEESKDFVFYRVMDRLLMAMENGYAIAVSWVLHHRAITVILSIALFAGGLFVASLLPSAFFPAVDRGEFDVKVELGLDNSIEESKRAAREIVESLSEFDWEAFAFTTIGGGAKKEKHIIKMRVMMKPKEFRSIIQSQAMDEVRKKLAPVLKHYGAKLAVMEVKAEGMETSPIQANIAGTDFTKIRKASEQLIAFMNSDGGFTDIINSDKGSKKEIQVVFNHDKMTALGINPAQTGLALRTLINGENISGITDTNGEEVEIKAYIDDAFKKLDFLRSFPLKGQNNQIIKLSDVADITYGNKLVEINRLDRIRKIGITASLAPKMALDVQAAKLRGFAEANFPAGVELVLAGDVEHMEETASMMGTALLVAIFLIYIVLASQFNSFIHPITIMMALPFALVGAVVSLYVFNQTLSMMSFIGIIMLMGIVTKNSILLVDYALQRTREGMDVSEALQESSRTRLRPILMTAGGTMLGMLPVVLSTANAAEIKHSLGFGVIGGLLFSTCITLFIVPVFFSLLNRFTKKVNEETAQELQSL